MNIITGTAENERLTGTSNNDSIDGGAGSDTLNGGSGNDYLFGGTGGMRTVQVILEEGYWEQGPDIEREEEVLVQEGYWEQGPDIEREEEVLVQEGYWEQGPDIEREVQIWIPMGSYEDEFGNWIEDGYYDTQIIFEPGEPVWVEPVYETRIITEPGEQVWVEPVYETQIIVEPGEEIWVEPIYGWEEQEVEDGSDYLAGGAGNDTLVAGATGGDTLAGGAGNDTYELPAEGNGNTIIEGSNEGIDTVLTETTATLGANVEKLELTGGAAINGTGNALANTLVGNMANNRLDGREGNDSLVGGAGIESDTLIGGSGNDTLSDASGTTVADGGDGVDVLRLDWSSLVGANLSAVGVVKTGNSFSGEYVAKNSRGNVVSSAKFTGIESLVVNGKQVDLVLNKPPGVSIGRLGSGVSTSEQGGKVEYNVVLDAAPRETVRIQFASSDATEGKVLTPELVFTAANWSRAQKLVVEGVDDFLHDGNVAYNVTGKIVTSDLSYNRIKVPSIGLLNTDDGQDNDRIINGTDKIDYLSGANGNDRIYGKGDQDELKGGRGNDRLYGENDDDRLFGELGNDQLYGGYDDDTLDGGVGSDSLFGEQGLDTLIGGAGDDYLDGGIENDSMVGGAGNDTYFVDSSRDVINDLGLTTDVDTVLLLQTTSYTLPANVENAEINAAAGNANLTGNGLDNELTGNAGRNVLNGGAGNDELEGGLGNDTMRGGAGVDEADFAAAGMDVRVDLATGIANGEGRDLLFDIENIVAGEGNDTLLGSTSANDLDGGAGIDELNGGGGNDTLAGCFFGANGGRGETDTLTGGAGIDIFQLGFSSGRFYDDGNTRNAGRKDYVLIADFTVGQDRLQLDGGPSNYYLGSSGVNGVNGIGLYAEQGATDELIAIIRSANAAQLNAANTINTAQFV